MVLNLPSYYIFLFVSNAVSFSLLSFLHLDSSVFTFPTSMSLFIKHLFNFDFSTYSRGCNKHPWVNKVIYKLELLTHAGQHRTLEILNSIYLVFYVIILLIPQSFYYYFHSQFAFIHVIIYSFLHYTASICDFSRCLKVSIWYFWNSESVVSEFSQDWLISTTFYLALIWRICSSSAGTFFERH